MIKEPKRERKHCIQCKEVLPENETIIVIPDGLLHYDCFDSYLGERKYSCEAFIKDGKVIDI